MFPTLLLAMGYEPDWVKANFGARLFTADPLPARRFLAGDLFGRYNSGRWFGVDP